MKIPLSPPPFQELLSSIDMDAFGQIFSSNIGAVQNGRYRHWDKLRHLKPPEGLTSEQWWFAVKLARRNLYQELPLIGIDRHPFKYGLPGIGLQMLQKIDRDASGSIEASPQVTDPQTRHTYLLKSLIEEAITSSQLEGASTTRHVAKEMIRTGRKPRDRSEQMIHNNYEAMQFVRGLTGEMLTPAHVIELQRILTQDAIDDPDASGRLRNASEEIHVADDLTGEPLHIPPQASTLPARLQALCDFANEVGDRDFIHPVIRSIVIHFWLGYDHPFVDGNGRTARALFYWSMAKQGYWLTEFLVISGILKKARSDYSRSFLYTETDDNDATYFILHQLRVIRQAIEELHKSLAEKAVELRETEKLLLRSDKLRRLLNFRQLALVNHALKNRLPHYSIESHKNSHGISYATSRSDLMALVRYGLLELNTRGRKFDFIAPDHLRKNLSALAK